MSRLEVIKEKIDSLSKVEFSNLRRWLAEKDWEKWDEEIEADSNSGQLDFLVREALDQKHEGKLKDL